MMTLLLVLAVLAPQEDSEKTKEARKTLAGLKERISEFTALNDKLKELNGQAQAAMKANDQAKFDEVRLEFNKVRAQLQDVQGKLSASAGEFNRFLEDGLKAAPEDAGLLDVRAEFREMFGDLEGARSDLESLTAKQPKVAAYAVRLGLLHRKGGGYADARKAVAAHVKDSPSALALDALCEFASSESEASVKNLEASAKAALAPAALAEAVGAVLKELETRKKEAAAGDLPLATIATSKGAIDLELFENQAPNAVASFITLAEGKFYDGLKFHRVIENFMAQGGCPKGTGSGDPGYSFADEFPEGYRRHFRGSLSMANSGPNTNGSQFFITHRPTDWLDGKHVVFGRVLKGQDVVDKLVNGDEIKSVTITRKRKHEYVVKKLGK